jgi:hypothetical protein
MQKHQLRPIIKMMKSFVITTLGLILFGCNSHKDSGKINRDFADKVQELVLSENKIGQEYFFKVILKNEVLEYRVTYLGDIINKRGDTLKFLTSIIYSGLYEDSKRANSKLFVYDGNNEKKGFYYIGGALDIPSGIENGNLVFAFNNERCNQTTRISFIDSIPSEIFIGCTESGGDLYEFRSE